MAMEAMSMTSITDRIEIQLDAGSTEVTLTRAEAVEVAQRLHRQGICEGDEFDPYPCSTIRAINEEVTL